MEIDRINFLLNNPTDATFEDIALIEGEIAKYPYAQMLHILLAKVEFQLELEDKQKKLGTAAIYASDRSILKKVITSNEFIEEFAAVVPYQEIPGRTFSALPEDHHIADQEKKDESASIFDEVLQNLEKLKSLREQFHFIEQSTEAAIEEKKKAKSERKRLKKEKKLHKKESIEDDITFGSEEKKRIQDEILEKDEKIDSQVNAYFLTEIEKKQPDIVKTSANRKEKQKEIIEDFIKAHPTIGPIRQEADKSTEETHRDLSERSTKFGDDLVSENLAIILLKQGKKERAIDIYKKLIWKLPQKKAYFAARIEEIKN